MKSYRNTEELYSSGRLRPGKDPSGRQHMYYIQMYVTMVTTVSALKDWGLVQSWWPNLLSVFLFSTNCNLSHYATFYFNRSGNIALILCNVLYHILRMKEEGKQMLRDMATKQIKLNFSFFSNAYLFTAETLKENWYSFLLGMIM